MRQQSVFNSQSSTQSCIVNCSYLDAICLIMKTNSERRSLLMNGRPIYRSVSRPPTLAAASGDTPAVGKRGCSSAVGGIAAALPLPPVAHDMLLARRAVLVPCAQTPAE